MPINTRPSINSERLRGEPVEKRHAAAMVRVLNDPRIHEFLSSDPPSLAYLERQYELLTTGKSPDGNEHWLTWILFAKDEESDPIGFIQATINEPKIAQIAYVLSPAYWRQGYAREAVAALLDVVFERYEVERVIAEMDTRNAASIGLVQTLGFRCVETVRDVEELNGSMSHEHVYELVPSEWQNSTGR